MPTPGELPTGLVTFLLSDIEGSTALWDADPTQMAVDLEAHDRCIAEVVAAHGGVLLKSKGEGDATFSVFEGPDGAAAALGAAIEVVRGLADLGALRVRLGLHSGEVVPRDGDYFGPPVNRAARVKGLGRGRTVVCSDATAALCVDALPPSAALVDLGLHALRGLTVPERIHGVEHPDLDTPSIDAPSVDRRPPQAAGAFVGRDADLGRLAAALAGHRFVSVVGLGGVGKSRLVAEAAAATGWDLAYVDVEPAGPGAVLGLALAACGIPTDATDLVAAFAGRSGPVLLVLDGCEDGLDDVADAATRLLAASEHVRVVATSRRPIDAAAEHVVDLGPLTPEDGRSLLAARLGEAGAAPADDAVVDQVTAAVDGIPLALELAAGRARTLGLARVATILAVDPNRTGDRRGVRAGARSLDDVVGWTWEQLEPLQRRVLVALCSFADGWTDDAGLQVAEAAAADAGTLDVLEAIDALVRASLVTVHQAGGSTRQRLLAPVRSAARARAEDPALVAAADERLVEWAQDVAAAAYAAYRSGAGEAWLVSLDDELANLDAALAHALTIEEGGLAAAAELVAHLDIFWATLGQGARRRAGAASVLDRLPSHEVPPQVHSFLAVQTAGASYARGDLVDAERLGAVAASVLEHEPAGEQRDHTWVSLNNLRAVIARADGRGDDAVVHARQALATAERLDHPAAISTSLHNLAVMLTGRRALDERIDLARRAVALNDWSEIPAPHSLELLARLLLERGGPGDPPAAKAAADRLGSWNEADRRAPALAALVQAAVLLSDPGGVAGAREALAVVDRGLELAVETGALLVADRLRLCRAEALLVLGDVDGAAAIAREVLDATDHDADAVREDAGLLLDRLRAEATPETA